MEFSSALLGAPFHLRRMQTHREGVTIFLLDVGRAAAHAPEIFSCLSVAERERKARFRSAEDRLRFGLTRSALRHVLAEITGQAPDSIVLATGPKGKPRLADAERPYFNVSHSGSRALVAVSQLRPIGVDIERIREISDLLGLAEAFFSPREAQLLVGLPPHQRESAFYAIWTGKESILKALGSGLGDAMRDFSVAPTEHGFSVVTTKTRPVPGLDEVCLDKIEVPEDYAAALALL